MKTILLLLTSIICIHSTAQKTEAYYDYHWKACTPEDARYYSEVVKTDSGWLRHDYFLGTRTLQMSGLFEDSSNKIANGYFRFYYANGIPESYGRNVSNKKEGLWMRYHQNGVMEDSTTYVNGNPSGISFGWYSNGYLADSVVYHPDGYAVEVNWHTNGTPSSAGRWFNGKLSGPWLFFHKNGKIAAREVYNMDQLVSREYYSVDGTLEDSTSKDRNATFPGGEAGWTKFMYRHIFFPPQYQW